MKRFILAGYPCLYVTTFETDRAIDEYTNQIVGVNEILAQNQERKEDIYRTFRWDMVSGLVNTVTGEKEEFNAEISDGTRNVPVRQNHPLFPLMFLNSRESNTILFLPNYHFFIAPGRDITVLQTILNNYPSWKAQGKSIVILSPEYSVATEVDKLFQLIDFPFPDEEQIREIMKNVLPESLINQNYDPASKDLENRKEYLIDFTDDAIRASKGMTEFEIENALSLSLTEKNTFDPRVISEIKQQQIRKSAALEISSAKHKFEDIVGLKFLKPYLMKVAMHPLAQGSLIVGVAGNGKTYIAEGLANEMGIPAVVVDFSKIMASGGGIVGQAQAQAIQTFKTIDAMSPCIAILDEIEKGLAGVESDARMGLSSGSKAGVGSIFLRWIEKKTPGVYVVATCNSIDSLPAEYKRAGRWDTIIGVDLPVKDEIVENLMYYGNKFLKDEQYDELLEIIEKNDYAFVDERLNFYSHAELMTIVKQMSMLECSIEDAMKFVRPIGKVDPERVDAIRKWIRDNATMASESSYGKAAALAPKTKELVKKRKLVLRPRKISRKE